MERIDNTPLRQGEFDRELGTWRLNWAVAVNGRAIALLIVLATTPVRWRNFVPPPSWQLILLLAITSCAMIFVVARCFRLWMRLRNLQSPIQYDQLSIIEGTAPSPMLQRELLSQLFARKNSDTLVAFAITLTILSCVTGYKHVPPFNEVLIWLVLAADLQVLSSRFLYEVHGLGLQPKRAPESAPRSRE